MQATGIVAEYNPFHNGHLHHLQQTKKYLQQPVVAVMSGNIMQRGEPALLDKWTRARLAVHNGIDLVLELPAVFSLRSAQYFAQGAVKILQACGCISHLSCGAENPHFDFIAHSNLIQSSAFQTALKNFISEGCSYAAAYEKTLQHLADKQLKLQAPNDILALEYCKALHNTVIKPIFIKRIAAGYNDTIINSSIASATAIRRAVFNNNLASVQQAVPADVWQTLTASDKNFYQPQLLWQLINYRLRILTAQQIADSCQCTEGMENLLLQASRCSSLEEALSTCSTKRYPSSRIRRLFMQLLLHQPAEYYDQKDPAYIRVLAFNDTGRQLLKQIKEHNNLPLLTRLGKNPFSNQSPAFCQQLTVDIAASELLTLLQQNYSAVKTDYLTSPYYYKK